MTANKPCLARPIEAKFPHPVTTAPCQARCGLSARLTRRTPMQKTQVIWGMSAEMRRICIIVTMLAGFGASAFGTPMGYAGDACSSLDAVAEGPKSVSLFRIKGAVLFRGRLRVDVDGAPRAYHPDSKSGLDRLANAGRPGNWWGIVTNNGEPSGVLVIQGSNDPAPGFHVAATSLYDPMVQSLRDPRKYVDATRIPYVALPRPYDREAGWVPGADGRRGTGVYLGDLALVTNMQTGTWVPAIFADVAPADGSGEASLELVRRIGEKPDARVGGSDHRKFAYVIFPGSGNHRPKSPDEIAQGVDALLRTAISLDAIKECVKRLP